MSEDINNMKDSWLFDQNFNGLSDEAFDDLEFFDFPLEDVETNVAEEDWDAQLKRLEHPSFDIFPVSSSGQFDRSQNDNLKLGRSFSASCNEIFPTEQLNETAEPAYGKFIPKQNVPFNGKDVCQIRTSSPVSVFESSSSSSCENSLDLPVIPVKGARSKRRRLSSLRLLFSIPFLTSASESDFEIDLTGKLSNEVNRKQMKKEVWQLSGPNKIKESSSQESAAPRKCSHCEVTKTPQWREGPLGPKTLCNACGVRYRSGRLFPEYRPAASPTFVASLHSNCHKKVIEMRNRTIQEAVRGSVLTSSCNNLLENSLG